MNTLFNIDDFTKNNPEYRNKGVKYYKPKKVKKEPEKENINQSIIICIQKYKSDLIKFALSRSNGHYKNPYVRLEDAMKVYYEIQRCASFSYCIEVLKNEGFLTDRHIGITHSMSVLFIDHDKA